MGNKPHTGEITTNRLINAIPSGVCTVCHKQRGLVWCQDNHLRCQPCIAIRKRDMQIEGLYVGWYR